MRNMFPQYDAGAIKDHKHVWKDAKFVFDTSALLNVYRYQHDAREEFMEAIGRLSDRIWIPYHVALEFNINRINVLRSQSKNFSDLKSIINKTQGKLETEIFTLRLGRSHSLIDPSHFLKEFSELTRKFLDDLDILYKNQQKLTSPDPLKERLDKLFEGKVGDAPSSQTEIDTLYKEANDRYASKVPPGYMDSEKDKSGSDQHHHLGISYKRKYGDFLVWKQILEYSKSQQIKNLVFITDDTKEDWWWKLDGDDDTILGPRPELVEEAKQVGGIENFLMYKPDGFLENSKKYINAQVSLGTIEEVRDVSNVKLESNITINDFAFFSLRAENSVFQWLIKRFDLISKNKDFFPDFLAMVSGKKFGFEVQAIKDMDTFAVVIDHISQIAKRAIEDRRFDMVSIVWVTNNQKTAQDLIDRINSLESNPELRRARNLVGFLDKENDTGDDVFVPLVDLPFDKEERLGRFPHTLP